MQFSLSYVQEKILGKLIGASFLRYSELKPEKTTDDLFYYHLQELIKKKFVEKDDKSNYFLTSKGKKLVQQFDAFGRRKGYFKNSVIAVTTRGGGNEILLQRRLRHPYFGDTYPGISGKIHYGEPLEAAATRKVQEETGLVGSYLPTGVFRSTRNRGDDIFEDTFYYVMYGEDPTGDLIVENEFGLNYWSTWDEIIEKQRENVVASPVVEEFMLRLRDRNFDLFYFHDVIELDRV